jgi:hypothetical protein
MQRFLINILRLTSAALLFSSCTPEMFRGLKEADNTFAREGTELFRGNLKQSLLYKTTIQYKERAFSSLTYFNALNDSVFKIVLITTFGNTLLEAEISRSEFKVNNVISYLNRKPILRLLEKDWRILLNGNFSRALPFIYSSDHSETVYDYPMKGSNNLYYYSEEKKSVTKIESYQEKKIRVMVRVDSYKDSLPENFSIEHPSLKLKLNMTLLKKVSNETAE